MCTTTLCVGYHYYTGVFCSGMLTSQVDLSSERLWRLCPSQSTSSSTSLRRSQEVIPRPPSWELLWRLAETSTLNYRTHTFHNELSHPHNLGVVRMRRLLSRRQWPCTTAMAFALVAVALLSYWLQLAQGKVYIHASSVSCW